MKYFLILLFLPFKLFAQDISGVWTGYLYNDTTKQKIQYELAISEFKEKPTGYSHTTFIIDSVKNIGVKSVTIKEKDGHFYIVDDKLIYNNYSEPPAKGVKQFSFLTLMENDSAEVLSGIWRTNGTKIYKPLTGSIYLEKKKKVEEALIVTKLVQLDLMDKLSFLSPEAAARLIALSNKPVSSNSNTALSLPAKSEGVKPKEKIIPTIKEEQVVAVKEKEVPKPSIIKKEVPVTIEKKRIASPPVINERPPIQKEVAQKPKPVVIAEKKVTKPAIIQEQKPVEKVVQKEKPVIVKEENKNKEIKPLEPVPNIRKEPEGPPAATEIAKRKIETIRTVEIAQDSLVFSLYDNGSVDGDTVSVLLNGRVIMPRVGLMERATNKTIYLTPDMGDSISVVMYAENLGSIPPNTGLLVIREGEKIYEIRFSGDLNKNSKIILVRKKEK